MADKRWIQKAVRGMRQDKPCTGSKFGSSSCPPGSRRYNLAKTFKAMAKKRAEGGQVSDKISLLMGEGYPQKQAVAIALNMNKRGKLAKGGKTPMYPFGGAINKGVTRIAKSLGASDENAQLWGSGISTLTGFIPGMQDNLLQGADLLGDIGSAADIEELEQAGQYLRPAADIAGLFTGGIGKATKPFSMLNPSGTFRHGGDPRFLQFHNLSKRDYNKAVINVEKDELEVKDGRVLTDYKAKPRHPDDKTEIDFYGNTLAKPGNIIVPKDKRDAYLKGDKIEKRTIEVQLKRDQNIRERKELGEFRSRDKYIQGLRTSLKDYMRRTGEKPRTVSQKSIFPPEFGVSFEDLGIQDQGGKVLPEFLFNARGRAMKKANPKYFKSGGKIRNYQGGGQTYSQRQYEDLFGNPLQELAPAYTNEQNYENFLTSQLADYYGKSQANYPRETVPYFESYPGTGRQLGDPYTTSTSKYSSGVSTANTKFDPFYNPGSANFTQNISTQDNGTSKFGFNDFAQFAPVAYNLGMGLFGKQPQTEAIQNPYAQRVKEIMSGRKIDLEPVFQDIDLATSGAKRQLRGLTGGSGALQLQGMQNIQNIAARNRAKARLTEQQANLGFRGEEAQQLDILGQQDVQAREKQRQIQLAMEANQAQYIPKGLEQLSGISQGRNQNVLLRQKLEQLKQSAIAQGNTARAKEIQNILDG